jgi:hypothetical protein
VENHAFVVLINICGLLNICNSNSLISVIPKPQSFMAMKECNNQTQTKWIKMNNVIHLLTGLFFLSMTAISQTDHSSGNITTLQKSELTKVYIQAIAEFVKAEYKKDKPKFDTLFFWKHVYGQSDDFPDIELPKIIENTHVKLVSPETKVKKEGEHKSLVFINMIGWVNKVKAEFILVVFTHGGEHLYDYTINFNYNFTQKEFVLNKIEFEDYLYSKETKPKRITIYIDKK